MGVIKKYTILMFLLITSINIYSQIVEIKKNDSILLRKSDNKNEYYITLFNKENIKYNKINGFKYDTIPNIGTVIKCNECRVESYGFLIRKIKNNKKNKGSIRTVENLFKDKKGFNFGGGYFLINGIYYKNLGTPIE
ncbi:hypothetical protein [Chryseobacterium sp.]|uniref:hypothetical protein n=1 Tax=Chryseobacterium sp. TaxID=1871047 RepID=UPI0028994D51|nr:hypothetical protein [Chryseobacterium sp.]